MWYAGGDFLDTLRIGLATSPDGITWTKHPNNPVMDVGPIGSWDENTIFGCCVLLMDTLFHMWYSGHSGPVKRYENYRIGHATSPDGISWEKDPANPVLDMGPEDAWDDALIINPNVLHDGTKFHMWYAGWNGGPENVRIGHATSQDGVEWTKDPENPILTYEAGKWDHNRVDLPFVVFDGTTYHLWYSGGDYFTWKIGYATSGDGTNWMKYGIGPVFAKGSPGSWDDLSVQWCTVIDSAGVKYKMWYCGSHIEETGNIGYAESLIGGSRIQESDARGFSVYPNPVREILHIHIGSTGICQVEISSVGGQVFRHFTTDQIITQIDLSTFSEGIYFVTIRSEDFISTRKFIKL
jgi:predicted GH43/DUF377 family glycosyl hydrolase